MTWPVRRKVLAYVLRHRGPRTQVLAFDHVGLPEAGTQVPAGGIDPGETPEEACLREVREETGLDGVRMVRFIGVFDYFSPHHQELQRRHVFVVCAAVDPPDDWTHDGGGDRGMAFACRWVDVRFAAGGLAGAQGRYLAAALRAETGSPSRG